MQIIKHPEKRIWKEILARPVMDFAEIEQRVKPIMERVKSDGDEALKYFSKKFDQVELDDFLVRRHEIEEAISLVKRPLKNAITSAKLNIEKFHVIQKDLVKKIEIIEGVTCWRKSIPIQKVGLYIPGGTAPLFSTVLMLGVPAKLAGCEEIVLCTPPNSKGKVHPAILFTANLIGIKKIYKVGGAQAIAALTYGTETIPNVYKIFGPGNQYVTAAKQLATKESVAIDMPAGPSEVAVMADETANPNFVAADLLSQAEHGVDSQVLLVTTSLSLLEQVQQAIASQLEELPRKAIAIESLKNSRLILVDNLEIATEIINEYAAEHLILSLSNADEIAEKIVNAGSVFIGHYTPESTGDYASGTNHTLPTNGYARNYSGVSLDSFFKKVTFQKITKDGIRRLAPTVETMALEEELFAHKQAVSLRVKQ